MIPYYSFIVLAYNNWAFTEQCLVSLIANMEQKHISKGIEIIIVDNGSNIETVRQLISFSKKKNNRIIKLELVLLKQNLGYPSGINVGIAQCKGEIIAVLNNDLLFPPNWLTPIVELLEANRTIGFAAPFLSYAGSSIQHVGKSFDTIEEMEGFAAYFMNLNQTKLISANKIVGACLLFRRDLLSAIGGNDFWFGIGNFDDVDWCIRARLAGYSIAVVGGSFVHHIGHASFLEAPDLFTISLEVNQTKFERKWQINEHLESPFSTLVFDREKHYIPIQITDFSANVIPLLPQHSLYKSLLLCADWSHPHSEWPEVINILLAQQTHIAIYCWVPASIFNRIEVASRLNQLLNSAAAHSIDSNNQIIIIEEEIPYMAILGLIRSADVIVRVPGDFVNQYILYLAEQIGIEII